MKKQIDGVTGDLRKQVAYFKHGGETAISVGIVGINHAAYTVGYEGDRTTRTTGTGGFMHPVQEAAEAERRLRADALPAFCEFVVLRYRATNQAPLPLGGWY